MFEEMVVSTSAAKKTNKPWTVLLSMALQVGLLAIFILIPLIYTEALPKTLMSSILLAPPPPPPPPPPPAAVQVVHVKPVAHLMDAGKLVAPKVIPKDIKIIKEDEAPPDMGGVSGGVPGGVAGGSMGGVLGGVIGGAGSSLAPPPPKATPKRIMVGGNVQAAHLVNRVQPSYPPLARQTRISGTVKLHAIIGKDGTVRELQVVSGHPLLVQSALDAVRQWRYQPTLLNGDPVEVDTEIDVIFSLAQ
ncbi:MAG TPA: energy transducer TonB [Candidatus Acidoferrum sp.]|nr:energy transducer TonB [Candidatus Acidoferrum sp.]